MNEVIVQVANGVDINTILTKYAAYNLSVARESVGMYLLVVGNMSQLFEIANLLHQDPLAKWCHPNFVANVVLSNDPYASSQYYHQNTSPSNIDLNTPEAWQLVKGCKKPIRVAVVDDGIDFMHKDLAPVVVAGYTVGDPNGMGQTLPRKELSGTILGHGTACAGIIGAVHNNNRGIKGVANNVNLVPVNFASQAGFTGYDIANSLNWAWSEGKADILSNSWAWFRTDEFPAITQAITNAQQFGRNGLGTVVVCSAGNRNNTTNITFPATLPNVITVGGIREDGSRFLLGRIGSEMDVVAFATDIATTDREGELGYRDSGNTTNGELDYNFTFGGNSAAAAQVAGIAALMLDANSQLTYTQIAQYLQESAIDMGTAGHDILYGHGRVDARRAVEKVLLDRFPSVPIGTFNSWLNNLIQITPYKPSYCIGDEIELTIPDLLGVNINYEWLLPTDKLQVLSIQNGKATVKITGSGSIQLKANFNLYNCEFTTARSIEVGILPNPIPTNFYTCMNRYQEFYPPLNGGAARYEWQPASSGIEVTQNLQGFPNGNRIGILTSVAGTVYLQRKSFAWDNICFKEDIVPVYSLDCGVAGCGNFTVYPNPVVTGELSIHKLGEQPIAICIENNNSFTYEISNTFGQVLKSGNLTKDITKISTDDLTVGLYHISIYSKEGMIVSQRISVVK